MTTLFGHRFSAVVLVTGILAEPRMAAAQSVVGPTVRTWQPNGTVNAMAIDGHTLYVGGKFDHVGPVTGSFAELDAIDASVITSMGDGRHPTGVVTGVVASDESGGWYVGRVRYPFVPGVPPGSGAPELLHVLPGGELDPAWTPPTLDGDASGVGALAVSAGRLFIGGSFLSVNGVSQQGLAALDAATGELLPWNPKLAKMSGRAEITLLKLMSNRLYVAGQFDTVGGAPRDYFAVIDASSGAPLPGILPPAIVNPEIFDIAVTSTRVYLRGWCRVSGSDTCAYDLDLNPVPGWQFQASPGGRRGPLAATASAVYATEWVSENRYRVIKLDPDTGAAVAWNAPEVEGEFNPPEAMAINSGTLYLAGNFTTVNGQPRLRVAAVDVVSGALSPWAPLVGGPVRRMAVDGAKVAIGGQFNSVGGLRQQNLVALDLRTGRPLLTTPAVEREVSALLKIGDTMLVGQFDGAATLIAFSTSTGIRLPESLSSNGTISALATDGRRLFIGGQFSRLAGSERLNLASIDLSTGAVNSWNPSAGGTVNTLVVSDKTVFAAGPFPVLAGSARSGVAAIESDSGTLLPFHPVDVERTGVSGFAVYDDRILLSVHRGTLPSSFRWVERTTGAELPTRVMAPAFLNASVQVGSWVYATTQHGALVILDAITNRVAFSGSGLASAQSVAANEDYVVVGGFGAIAAFQTPRAGAPQRMTASVVNSTVSLGWRLGVDPAPSSFLVEAGTVTGGTDVGTFDVGLATTATGALAPGTYFTRVRGRSANGPGAASSEVVLSVPATPTPPQAPGTLTASVSGGVVTLGWQAAAGNATSYVVEAGSASGLANLASLPTGHLDTTFATPAPAGTYFVRVRASNAFGVGPASNEVVVIVR